MITLIGAIAASTRIRYRTPPRHSDLFVDPPYFTLSSGLYPSESEDSLAPRAMAPVIYRRSIQDTGDWEGGLDGRPGAQGWYKFDMALVEMGGLFVPHDISVSSTLNPEYSVENLRNNAQIIVDNYGWDAAYNIILNNVTNTYTSVHKNIVRPNTTLSHPTSFLSGQSDEGAVSLWIVHSDLTPGTTVYTYGVDQEQNYIKLEDPSQGYVPDPVVFDDFQKQIAFAFSECDGPSCPSSYTMLWSIEKVVEVNFPAIMDWIMPPR